MIVIVVAESSSRTLERTRSPSHNLPLPVTSLVGRRRELDRISEAIRRARLITLSGPGGVGKTRLALELARRQAPRRADGVWVVDLAAAPETPDVAGETARVLGLRVSRSKSTTDVLRQHLTSRELLLVLDNCEHVVGPCAALTAALLSSCPHVRIIATSREVLQVPGEHVWRLEPLGPDEARQLFVERARERGAELPLEPRREETVGRLCERLDRLPLAIELAAGRAGVMSVEEILEGVDSQLGVLGGGRLATPRHRTLRATVEWSHKLLNPEEQEVLRSLAVFVGGFDINAAAAVAPALSIDLLARLVEKSLVSVVKSTHGRTRYRLLETVREYEHELLVEAGGLDTARERHLRHFSAVADVDRDGWPSVAGAQRVAELQGDYENVRAALEWAAAANPCAGMTLFDATWELFQMFGQADGVRLGELLLEHCPSHDRTRVLVQISVGGLRMMQADMEGAREMQEQARTLSRQLGERSLEGWARLFQGLAATLGCAVDPGRQALTEARNLLRESGAHNGAGKAIAGLGLIELITGRPERAEELVQEALSIQVAAGDLWSQGQCHTYLGMIAETNSDLSSATAHYQQAVEALRPFRDGTLLPTALALQGGVIAARHPKRGLRVVAAACAMRARAGGEFAPVFRERVERAREAAEDALGADADVVAAEAARLRDDEAIELAFGAARPRPSQAAGLSRRELEVARLVGAGLPNKAIASQLHLSVRTVESHVRHTLTKLGLQNRTEVAAWIHLRDQ